VEVSRQQVESEREALIEERRVRDEEIRPVIEVDSDGGIFRGDGQCNYAIGISNVGNTASGLTVNLVHSDGRIQRLHAAPLFDKGQPLLVHPEVPKANQIEGSTLVIEFRNRLGRVTSLKYLVGRQSDHPHSSLSLQRIEA